MVEICGHLQNAIVQVQWTNMGLRTAFVSWKYQMK